MDFVVGIDGGGTRTSVYCKNVEDGSLSTNTFGACNLNGIGREAFITLLREITQWIGEQGNCLALCMGAAGISNPEMKEQIALALEEVGITKWRLVGDHEIALSGALAGKAGIALISGTGSICIGRNKNGEVFRAGGWGHLIGDGGSGYRIGRDALTAVTKQWDGMAPITCLTELIMDYFSFHTPSDLVSYFYSGDKSRIAQVSRLVEQGYQQGDHVSQRIIHENATELVELISGVSAQINLSDCHVALLGGLLFAQTALRGELEAQLSQKIPTLHCIAPRESACTGAVILAEALLNEGEHA